MDILNQLSKLEHLANVIESQTLERLHAEGISYEGHEQSAKVSVIPGNKYFKLNVAKSGKYMVDREGNIFGIKGYGQVHKGHYYGTLDTVNQYSWGGYTAHKKDRTT